MRMFKKESRPIQSRGANEKLGWTRWSHGALGDSKITEKSKKSNWLGPVETKKLQECNQIQEKEP